MRFLTFALVGLSACSLSPDAYRTRFAEANCAWADRCGADQGFADADACVDAWLELTADPNQECIDEACPLDQAAAKECLAWIDELECGGEGLSPSCEQAVASQCDQEALAACLAGG